MVLPWAPATAMLYFMRMSSASISARWMTGTKRSVASSTSGLSGLTAEEITTTSTSPTFSSGGRKRSGAEPVQPLRRVRLAHIGARHAEVRG